MVVKHSDENCEKLATEIVRTWDKETLIIYAVSQVENYLLLDEEAFQREWNEVYNK